MGLQLITLGFLNDKFEGQVISRRTDHLWPEHSPDLNLLDFHFLAAAQSHVYKEKHDSINSLVYGVKTFTEDYSQEITRKVCANVLKRAIA